ncbi:hypothetical protein CQW23_10005 [Capsicum baccatum]|uniref:Uncharacterized protein n=1 Tax=Capsicum baccatum TaxID=33114 RepID=A0A2G2WYE8_CAPBA|nr:hypothetical protein CQW23_10005 [Capsicum baccatum]
MEPQLSKGKAKAGPSAPARKRSRLSEGQLTRVPRAPPLQRGQVRKFDFKVVRKNGKQWYTKHTDAKNILEVRGKVIRFIAADVNDLLGIPETNLNFLRQFIVSPPYAYIRHLLCGQQSSARWTRHRVVGLHSSFPYTHMNKKASMWGRIMYVCLIQGKHMTKVTTYRVGRSFGFRGLVTRFLRRHRVDEEELDYKPETRTDKVVGRMYGLMMMMTRTRGRPATPEELHAVELDYPLGHHARTMLRISLDFVEPIGDGVPTNKEHRYNDSDIESDEEEQFDDDSDDVDVDLEDMAVIVSFE